MGSVFNVSLKIEWHISVLMMNIKGGSDGISDRSRDSDRPGMFNYNFE